VRAADVRAALAGDPAAGPAELAEPVAEAVAGLADAMVRLVAGGERRVVETNPVILTADGRAVVADALVELAGKETP
jgi:succinyl-CoA synthetase beta subunit